MSSGLVKYKNGLPSLPRRPAGELGPRPSVRRDEREQGMDLAGVYGFLGRLLARRKWLIVSVSAAVIVASLLQVLTMTPLYRTTTTIEIQPDLGRTLPYKELSEAAEDFITTETYVQTRKEVLRSRALALRVVDRLELARDVEFNLDRRRGILIDPPMALIGRVRGWLSADTPGGGDPRIGLADRIIEDLDVQVMVNTRLVEVGYSSHSAELSAAILNTLVDELIELEFAERLDASARSREFLQRQLVELKAAVDLSDAALKEYANRQNILSIDGRQQFALNKLVDLQQEATRLEAQMIAERAQLQELETASAVEFPQGLKNETILQLQQRLSALNQELASFSTRFGADWPAARSVRKQIDEVTEQLAAEKQRAVATVRKRYQASREQSTMLSEELDEQKRRANMLDQDLVQYNTLKQAAETDRELFDSLLQRVKELGVVTGLKSTNVRVLDAAAVPKEVHHPNKPYFAIVSLLLGLTLGLAAAFLIESLDQTVRSPEDVVRVLDLPCLGVIPGLEPSRSKRRGPAGHENWSEAIRHLIALQQSGGWEAYRSLRTAIVYSTENPTPRAIMVASPLAGEGRTFTVVNLGVALAQLGARVVLVDLDLRDPGIAATLDLDHGDEGMTSFLSEGQGHDVLSYVRETFVPNLSVVPAGIVPPNPPELIGSDRMLGALDTLKKGFDVVLFDTPPLLSYTDGVVLSLMVDQVILLARNASTPRRALERAGEQLEAVRDRVLGGVIDDADMRGSEYAYRPGSRRRSPRRQHQRSPQPARS